MKPKSPCEIRKRRFPQMHYFFRSDMGEWRGYWPTPGDEGESDQRKFYDFTRECLLDAERERAKEMLVFAAAGFGSAATHFESTERMPADHRTGTGPIDINIPSDEFGFDPLDVSGTAREESGGEGVIGIVRNSDRIVEIARFQHTQHRPENFTLT